jgi:hypothetical protein
MLGCCAAKVENQCSKAARLQQEIGSTQCLIEL